MTHVKLQNRARRARTFNLDYRICKDLGLCVRQRRAKVRQMSDGNKRLAPEDARLSTSITLRGRGKPGSEAILPASVLRAPEIKQAIADGSIHAEHCEDSNQKPEPKRPPREPEAKPTVEKAAKETASREAREPEGSPKSSRGRK